MERKKLIILIHLLVLNLILVVKKRLWKPKMDRRFESLILIRKTTKIVQCNVSLNIG